MGARRMQARFPGRCRCGGKVSAGDAITYDGGIVGCGSCGNGADAPAARANGASDSGATVAPRAPRAPRQERRALPQPTREEAHAALVALASRLDPWQREIAAWRPGAGNLRAVAGAGSGKTTTMVALVGALVSEGAAHPTQIIATTFTRKAAGELQERLARVLPPGALDLMRVGTFHSIAGRIIGRVAPGRFDPTRNLDGSQRAEGIPSASLLWDKILGWAGPTGLPGTGEEGLGLNDPDVRAYMLATDVVRSAPLTESEIDSAMIVAERESGLVHLARAWATYKRVKGALGAWDFADVLAALHAGLASNQIPDGARVVIVDESQDNSAIQIEIARLLAANGKGEIILVGDVRQSIYGWRGAAPEMFLHADATINARTLELPVNYRSGSEIVALGNRVAEGKVWTLGEATRPGRDTVGAVSVAGYGDTAEEADAVAAEIAAGAAAGGSLNDVAILTRTNAAAGSFEAALVKARIPCVVVGGTPFFTRREVADFLAYCKLTVADDLDALARIVNRPKRMLGRAFADAAKRAPGATVADRVAAAAETWSNRTQRAAARDLAALLGRLRTMPWGEATQEIARVLTPPESRAGAADEDRGGLLATCATIAESFTDVAGFLAFAARCAGEVMQAGTDDDLPQGRVVISTVHKAKGLEWTTVYLSATAGIFPHSRCEGNDKRMQEEERLFYVAATRAKDALRLTWAARGPRRNTGGPSPFLSYVAGFDPEGGGDEPPRGGGERVQAPFPADGGGPALLVASEATPVGGASIDQPRALLTDSEDEGSVSAPLASWEPQGGGDPDVLVRAKIPFDSDAWCAALAVAQTETDAEPKARAGEGGRYVTISEDAMRRLLEPLGFAFGVDAGQVVALAPLPRARGTGLLKVYTSIPGPGKAARDVGEDSMKVAALWHHGRDDGARPLHCKLPYACRTRGWRLTLLSRIAEVAPLFANEPCRRCGAPTIERKRVDGTTFKGCVRWQACKNEPYARIEVQS